jgi:hypothetical protein
MLLSGSTLTLLVARIAANDVQLPVAAHELAVLANSLHAGSNLHRRLPRALAPEKMMKLLL